jgi:hypothetical protein
MAEIFSARSGTTYTQKRITAVTLHKVHNRLPGNLGHKRMAAAWHLGTQNKSFMRDQPH